jgi:glutathione S-transferase
MYILYHYPLCPLSRQIRVILKEKNIDFELVQENYWEKQEQFLKLNPMAEVPVLSKDAITISDAAGIYEYLEETYLERNLLGQDPAVRADTRRIANSFNNRFYNEVSKPLINERLIRFLTANGAPNSNLIRQSKANIYYFLDYIAYLVKMHKWLASESLSIADIVAASHLSVLDYFGDVPWDYNPYVKDWYSVIKSRPSFRALLSDRLPGFLPVKHYEVLDF